MNTRTLVLHCTLLAVTISTAQTTALWGRKQGHYGGTFGVGADQYSNVYGTGFISSPASFDTLVFACEPVDPFVVKYNADGALQWAHTVPPGGGNAKAIAVDADGNSLVAGQFGGNQVCARYDASGTYLWHGQVGGTGGDAIPHLTEANGAMRLSGFFTNTADVDVTSGVSILSALAGTDVFLCSFNAALSTGVQEAFVLDAIAYPVPTSNNLMLPKGTARGLVVFDGSGRTMPFHAHGDIMDVGSWAASAYLLRYADGQHQRIIVQH
ncbi:MAG: hypothetical protein ABI432_18560 [Flavobacteriales bacterium]